MLALECLKLLLELIVKQMMHKLLICLVLPSKILCLTGVTIYGKLPRLYFCKIAIGFL
jgi:hypothetical protein